MQRTRVPVLLVPVLCWAAFIGPTHEMARADETDDMLQLELRVVGTRAEFSLERRLSAGAGEATSIKRNARKVFQLLRKTQSDIAALEARIVQAEIQLIVLNDQLAAVSDVATNNRLVGSISALQGQIDLANKSIGKLKEQESTQRANAESARESYVQHLIDLGKIADQLNLAYELHLSKGLFQEKLDSLAAKSGKPLTLTATQTFDRSVRSIHELLSEIHSEMIPLRRDGNTYYATVVVDGKHTQEMIVDSGASLISLPFQMAVTMGLRPQASDKQSLMILADGSRITAHIKSIPLVRVGSFECRNVPCAVLGPEAINASPLLGMTFLGEFQFKLNPADSTLSLTRIEESGQGSSPARDASPRVAADSPDRKWPSSPEARLPPDAPPAAHVPFSAAQAKQFQDTWARYLDLPAEFTNSIGMTFRLVPPGSFVMGSVPLELEKGLAFAGNDEHWRKCVNSEAPQHRVFLSQPMYVGIYEVTQSEFELVTAKNSADFSANGTQAKRASGIDTAHYPVENVSWTEAAEFCSTLNARDQLSPTYARSGEVTIVTNGNGYRLMTEAEWEYCCRAGTSTVFISGDDGSQLDTFAWTTVNADGHPQNVGMRSPNAFGLYDFHGNVWEWVQDSWGPDYYSQFVEHPAINPSGPQATAVERVIRGGGWHLGPMSCRSALRLAFGPGYRGGNIGFRVVVPAATAKETLSASQR